MLTELTGKVDGHSDQLWVTVSELANIKGVKKQAVSKRLKGLEERGLVSTKPGPRGSKLVNRAEYDHAIGEAGDAVKENAAETVKAEPRDPRLRDAQADKVSYEAELRKLDLAERRGQVVAISGPDGVEAAMVRAGEIITRQIESLPRRADELATVVARDGAAGARVKLKEIARDMQKKVAEALIDLQREGEENEARGEIEADLFGED